MYFFKPSVCVCGCMRVRVCVTADTYTTAFMCSNQRTALGISPCLPPPLCCLMLCTPGWLAQGVQDFCLPSCLSTGGLNYQASIFMWVLGIWAEALPHNRKCSTYWAASQLEIYVIYIIWSKRQKLLLWFGCLLKIHVLETQSSKFSVQRCWEMRPNDPAGAESSWTGHCQCQGSR